MAHPHAKQAAGSPLQRLARGAAGTAAYLGIRSGIAAISIWPPEQVLDLADSVGRKYAELGRRRLKRAMNHLEVAYPEWDKERRREAALASHAHLFRLGAELAYSPRLLTEDGWPRHLDLGTVGPGLKALISSRPCILLTGHCGNWELLGYAMALLGFPMHAVYRPLDLAPLDRWVLGTRARRGLTLVEKFGARRRLPQLLTEGAPLGFTADQNAGDRA